MPSKPQSTRESENTVAAKKTPIDPLTGPAFVLKGRIVTMSAGRKVVASGCICIESAVIRAITSGTQALPAAFRDAPVIDTKGTIFPGMIELHNHLSYNVIPPWQVPKRFGNRGQWASHPDKRRLISQPMQVIAGVKGTIEALVRYVEAKCLIGGVTTSQGVTLVSDAGIGHRYRGIVRNVEQTDDPELPEAQTRIPDIDDAKRFRERLDKASDRPFLLHLAEGIDDSARKHFQNLKLSGSKWAIRKNLVGIHAAGLRDTDYVTFQKQGGSMVWSPLSNLLLYGGTADIKRAKKAKLKIALGSDWSPSGSKNLLAELKVAFAVSEELGGVFKPHELVQMVTSAPAEMMKWDAALGSIEVGKRADFVVTRGKAGDPYLSLVKAQETDVALVVVNGVPRYGDATLMQGATKLLFPKLASKLEARTVGGQKYRFNLVQESSDPLVAAVPLKEAERRLRNALKRLPELASATASADPVGAALAMGIEPAARQASPNLGLVGSSGDEAPSVWRIELENESKHDHGVRPLAPAPFMPFFAANTSLAQSLIAMDLDPLTIAEDDQYFERLEAQPNLPEYLKKALPKLHGVERPVPQPVGATPIALGPEQPPRASSLDELAAVPDPLSLKERRQLVRQARHLLEDLYVHLPLKRAAHAVDPLQRLRLLEMSLEPSGDSAVVPAGLSGIAFHRELVEIFTELRDLHTVYVLPSPYRDLTAVLPFLVEQCFTTKNKKPVPQFIVSKVAASLQHPTFKQGVEVLYWNGVPIETAIRNNGESQGGSNLAARFARGLATLTIRPLMRSVPPDEQWVVVGYRDDKGDTLELRLPWELRSPPTHLVTSTDSASGTAGATRRARGRGTARNTSRRLADAAIAQRAAIGVDIQLDAVNGIKRDVYARRATEASQRIRARELNRAKVGDNLATSYPGVLRARSIPTKSGTFGYLRIFSFSVHDADDFVREVVRLIARLPKTGLIIDVRNNGGGLITTAEQLLQLFTARAIEPSRVQFIASPTTRRLAERHSPSPDFAGFSLAPWLDSIRQATVTGEAHSTAHPLTPVDHANSIGQKYKGPVTLIADALCYSATDMFVAGFQDHDIGPIIAVDENIGAGGANVWDYAFLQELLPDTFPALPANCDLRVAIRRTLRVGKNAGVPLEDLGISLANEARYYMTPDDVLGDNADLMEFAGRQLKKAR